MPWYVCGVIRQDDGRQIWEGQWWSGSHTCRHTNTPRDPASVLKAEQLKIIMINVCILDRKRIWDEWVIHLLFFTFHVTCMCLQQYICVQAPPVAYFFWECKYIKSYTNESRSKCTSPHPNVCGNNHVVVLTEQILHWSDYSQKIIFTEMRPGWNKGALLVWSHNSSPRYFPVFSKHTHMHNSHPSILAWPRFKFINRTSELADTAITPSKINSRARG